MFSELKENILDLEGIKSCKITGENQINEIHIIASNKREPKKIVRDIETLVLVNLDREIDHKKISIAQLNSRDEVLDKDRIIINSIFRENNKPVCHYILNIEGNEIEEKVTGAREDPIEVTVVEGLVEIIEKYTDFEGKIRVDNVFTTGINNNIVVVEMALFKGSKLVTNEELLGAVYINNNLPLAAGKACLKALNRRIFY